MIYAMPGMETKMHAVINKEGEFDGLSVQLFSGDGFSHMRFKFHGVGPGRLRCMGRPCKIAERYRRSTATHT